MKKIEEKFIIKTLAFFDMFDFPMTTFEIYQYLGYKCSLGDVYDVLDNSLYLRSRIEKKDSYYFLKGRREIVNTRLRRYHSSDRKHKKAIRYSWIFSFFPWVKLVAMANMIGADNLREGSDIDLFIVTSKKRIWVTRFFCVSLIKLLNARPRPGKERDKICLSFFVSERGMDLSNLMIEDDIYFRYWFVSLFPIINRDKSYEALTRKNKYLNTYFPNWQKVLPVKNKQAEGLKKDNLFLEMFDLFFGGLDKALKKLQLKILAPALKKNLNKDTRVVMNDNVLKMYAKDRREIYRKRYCERLKSI